MREPRLLGRAMLRVDVETVNVRLVCGFERPSIERLLEFYIYDSSELETPDSDDLEFDDQGSYAPFPGLESYWCVDGSVRCWSV
jgi:hypothetical protein